MKKIKFICASALTLLALTSCNGLGDLGGIVSPDSSNDPSNSGDNETHANLGVKQEFNQLEFMNFMTKQLPIFYKKEPINFSFEYRDISIKKTFIDTNKNNYKEHTNSNITSAHFGTSRITVLQSIDDYGYIYDANGNAKPEEKATSTILGLERGEQDGVQYSGLNKNIIESNKESDNNITENLLYKTSSKNEIITNNLSFKLNDMTCSSVVGLANYEPIKQGTNKLNYFSFCETELDNSYIKTIAAYGDRDFTENGTKLTEHVEFYIIIHDNYLERYQYDHWVGEKLDDSISYLDKRTISINVINNFEDEKINFDDFAEYKETTNLENTNLKPIEIFYRRDGILN